MWLKGIVAAVFGYGFTDIPKKKYDICRLKITGLENVSHMYITTSIITTPPTLAYITKQSWLVATLFLSLN